MKLTLQRWLDGDVAHSFRTSPVAMLAALIAFACIFAAVFAELGAPHNPFDLATLELRTLHGVVTELAIGRRQMGRVEEPEA